MVLAACESGVAGSRVPDEVVGLPVALFEAGAATVVGAQWAVGEDATLVILSGFYERCRDGLAAGEALRRAQIWARDATNGQIAARFPDIPTLGGASVPARARPLWAAARRYRHPADWAAFTCVGGLG